MADDLLERVNKYFNEVSDEQLIADLEEAGFKVIPLLTSRKSGLLNLRDGSKITVAELAEKLRQGHMIQFWVGDNGYTIFGYHYRAPMLTLWPENAFDLTEREGIISYRAQFPVSALAKVPPEYENAPEDAQIYAEVTFRTRDVHWVDILEKRLSSR